ncbi:AB-hydrolase YheT [Cristinia sonorae]|uniref:AB-hydrolase YheT n=1 Tax=Cristinia sonorae TaxID=1940300 RepID=A0A8K0V0B1_9AGAR|nr:AB-hydrolase YheT [Cristinia sonorae]
MSNASASMLAVSYFLLSLGRWILVLVDNLISPFRRTPRVDFYHCDDSARSKADAFDLGELVASRVPSLRKGFQEAWWLPIGDTQTIYSAIGDFSAVDPVVYDRKFVQTVDGGILALDITPPLHSHPIRNGELVIAVAHGLTGGSHEHYVRAALTRLCAPVEAGGLGARAVVLNFRGCNGTPVITPRLYHAGSSDDYRTCVAYVSHTFPQSTILGLGFSLGANILSKYLGEEGIHCPLTGAAVLANPWNFRRGSDHIEFGTLANRYVYRFVMGGALQTLYKLHRKSFFDASHEYNVDLEGIRMALEHPKPSLKEFEALTSAPMFGFKDADHYYTSISSSRVLDNVRVPLLGLNARDDPMVADVTLPLSEVKQNPWVVLAVTPGGGHMGWFEQREDGTVGRWYPQPLAEYFNAIIEAGLPPRPKVDLVLDEDGWVRQPGRDDVAFLERGPETLDLVVSGMGESKLLSGF